MDIQSFVKKELAGDYSGHSYLHGERVASLVKKIVDKEGGNLRICLAAAYLHDCVDEKLFSDIETQMGRVIDCLKENGYSEKEINETVSIISTISFHKEKDHPLSSHNAMIVSDADKFEAIGAIGIIRTVEYGASKKRPFYDDKNLNLNEDGTFSFKECSESTLSHFYQKLLLLGSHFYTKTGQELAKKRLSFLKEFLDEFYYELSD